MSGYALMRGACIRSPLFRGISRIRFPTGRKLTIMKSSNKAEGVYRQGAIGRAAKSMLASVFALTLAATLTPAYALADAQMGGGGSR